MLGRFAEPSGNRWEAIPVAKDFFPVVAVMDLDHREAPLFDLDDVGASFVTASQEKARK